MTPAREAKLRRRFRAAVRQQYGLPAHRRAAWSAPHVARLERLLAKSLSFGIRYAADPERIRAVLSSKS